MPRNSTTSRCGKRARNWLSRRRLEVPTRLVQCKTPMDLFNEQMRFWQSAAADYTEGSRRLSAAWGAAAMPKLNGTQPHDHMTVAEPKDTAAVPKRSDRKAA